MTNNMEDLTINLTEEEVSNLLYELREFNSMDSKTLYYVIENKPTLYALLQTLKKFEERI